MTHKYLILVLFCTWGPPLRFIGCSRMDAKAIVNAICHENSAACLPWFIFCKHIIKDHPAVIGASSSFFPRQCLLWVPAIGWKEGAHIDVYTPPPHFFHALVTCKTDFYFACLIFYSSMDGICSYVVLWLQHVEKNWFSTFQNIACAILMRCMYTINLLAATLIGADGCVNFTLHGKCLLFKSQVEFFLRPTHFSAALFSCNVQCFDL